MDKLSKTIVILDKEIMHCFNFFFNFKTVVTGSFVFLGLEAWHSMKRIDKARTLFHKIGNICNKYLKH